MKIKKYIRQIAYVLLMCFAVAELSSVATVLAAERQKREEEKQWMRDAGAGLVDWRDQYDPLKEEDVPRAVGYEEAVWKNHVERMYDEEGDELNNVIFKNADGSRTKYVFDYPVKYVDKKGKVHDSSFEIGDSKDGRFKYETVASVSKTRFPKDIRDGIELSGEDVLVTLVPHDAKNAEPKRIDEETISYEYDENTTIEYSLTYTGFKEDIVVDEYTGQTEYEFTIYTEGLTLTEIDDSYYLVDENEEIKATIGDIIIFTADEKNNAFGELRAETIVENEEYRMTIVLDPEYLADPDTVYPIRIDPTVEITYDNNGSGAIEDVTINSLKGSSGSSGSLSVGLREKYGISRILMKFPGLNLSSLGTNVKITEATVELRDLMCEGTNLEVSCYVFSGNEWTESTANWSNVSPNSISTFLSSQVMTYATGKTLSTKHRYSFDITEAVKGWVVKTCNQDKGIIFKASPALENGSTYDCRTIASYNRASNKPSLSVTYSTPSGNVSNGSYYLNNKNYGQYLQYGGTAVYVKSGLLSTYGGSFQWEIVNVGDGCVIRFKSDPTKYLAVPEATSSSNVVIMSLKDDVIPDRCIWTFSSATGGAYLIKNAYNKRYLYSNGTNLSTVANTGASGTSSYNSRVWRVVSTSYYGNTDSYSKRELTSSFTINNMVLDIGETVTPTINRSTKENLWSDASDFTYKVSNTAYVGASGSALTAKKSGSVTVTATHKVTGRVKTFTVKVNKNAIIILPGFMGSTLELNSDYLGYKKGDVFWDMSLTELNEGDALVRIESLKCWENGKSIADLVAGQDDYGVANFYEPLYNSINNAYGCKYEVSFFAYDWRLSNKKSAQQLNEYITANAYDKVILVAHSMGGLVASNYLALGSAQQNKVDKLITLGSPLLGTPIAPYVWGSEDIKLILEGVLGGFHLEMHELFLYVVAQGANLFSDIFKNFTGLYEVFPSAQYFTHANQPYLTISALGVSPIELDTHALTQTSLTGTLPNYNVLLAALAKEINNSLYVNGEHITSLVDSYYIAGVGKDMPAKIEFNTAQWLVKENSNDTDSVVPVWSATLADRYADKTFFVKDTYHMNIIDNPQALVFVNRLIDGNISIEGLSNIEEDYVMSE